MHQPLPGLAVLLSNKYRRIPRLYFYYSPWGEEYLIRQRFGQSIPRRSAARAWVRKRIEGFVIRRSDRVVVISQYTEDQLRAIHGIQPDKVSRLSGAVDTDRFRPACSVSEARRQLKWPSDDIVLLTVRNLEPRMGIENLIRALKRFEGHRMRLYIVGSGSLREFLERTTHEFELDSAVSFLGLASDEQLPLMYQAADAFILPTRELEGFGLVTVEALASGCPVLATPIGATPEILSHLDPNWLARGVSPDDIGDVIERFIEHRTEWPSYRRQCALHARERYSWDRVVTEVGRLTAQIVGDTGHSVVDADREKARALTSERNA